MSIQNIVPYMSFFFAAKYANINGITARNIAPKIDSIPDIYTKTAKITNTCIKHIFSKYKNINLPVLIDRFNDERLKESVRTTLSIVPSSFVLSDCHRNKINAMRAGNINEYCSFNLHSFVNYQLMTPHIPAAISITNQDYINFYLSLVVGANISSTTLLNVAYHDHWRNASFSDYVHRLSSPVTFGDHSLICFNGHNEFDQILIDMRNVINCQPNLVITNNTQNENHLSIRGFSSRLRHNVNHYQETFSCTYDSSEAFDNSHNYSFCFRTINFSNYYNEEEFEHISNINSAVISNIADGSIFDEINYKYLANGQDDNANNLTLHNNFGGSYYDRTTGIKYYTYFYFYKLIFADRVITLLFSNRRNPMNLPASFYYKYDIRFLEGAYNSSASYQNVMNLLESSIASIFTTETNNVNDND